MESGGTRAHERVRALLSGRLAREADRSLLIMLSAYIDDSESDPAHTGYPHYVLAGYASTIKGWAGFDEEWTHCVRHESPRMKKLETAALFALKGPYDRSLGWNEQKQEKKINRLSEIAARHARIHIAIALDMKEFAAQRVMEDLGKDGYAFYFCYGALLEQMPGMINKLRMPGIRVDMVYDEMRKGQANRRAEQLFAEEIAEAKKTWLNRIIPSTRRIAEHLRSGKLPAGSQVSATEVLGGKTSREIAEQIRIKQLGGLSRLENVRNPIGPNRQHLLGGGN